MQFRVGVFLGVFVAGFLGAGCASSSMRVSNGSSAVQGNGNTVTGPRVEIPLSPICLNGAGDNEEVKEPGVPRASERHARFAPGIVSPVFRKHTRRRSSDAVRIAWASPTHAENHVSVDRQEIFAWEDRSMKLGYDSPITANYQFIIQFYSWLRLQINRQRSDFEKVSSFLDTTLSSLERFRLLRKNITHAVISEAQKCVLNIFTSFVEGKDISFCLQEMQGKVDNARLGYKGRGAATGWGTHHPRASSL